MKEEANSKITQYFQLIAEKKLGEAEKRLDEIRQTAGRSEQEAGYLKALEGLLLTYRSSDDKYQYLSNIELTAKNVEALKKEFAEQAAYPLFENYDKGYFLALSDFMKVAGRLRPWRKYAASKDKSGAEKSSDAM